LFYWKLSSARTEKHNANTMQEKAVSREVYGCSSLVEGHIKPSPGSDLAIDYSTYEHHNCGPAGVR
jgi:hypothetical protein